MNEQRQAMPVSDVPEEVEILLDPVLKQAEELRQMTFALRSDLRKKVRRYVGFEATTSDRQEGRPEPQGAVNKLSEEIKAIAQAIEDMQCLQEQL